MSEWFAANIGTIIAGSIVLLVVVLNIVNMVRRKKRGQSIIECGGKCSTCDVGCGAKNTDSGEKLGLIKTVLGIEGMECGMCEAHINDCIRNSFDIKNVYSSLKKGETVVISKMPLNESAVRNAVELTGYKVLSYSSEEL